MSRIRILCASLLTLLVLPGPARAGEFIDTRLTFTLGDDNFLKNSGEQLPNSPKLGIGDREGYELPFDNLDSASTGRENELHLVLYKKVDGILPGLTTEAAAALEINIEDMGFKDDSSYIRLAYAIDEGKQGDEYIDLVLFPLSGDRFRVGYLYDLTWGGSDVFLRSKSLSPAFKLGGNHGLFYWWAGMKMVMAETAPREVASEQGTKADTTEYEMTYSVLAGLGVKPVDGLSIDLSGGYIQQGWSVIKDEGVLGTPVTATGLSARIAYGKGLKVGLSSDLKLLRNDAEYNDNFGRKSEYDPGGGVSWSVSIEGNAIGQVLADFDAYGATKRQWAWAAAANFRLQRDYLRLNMAFVARSLAFNMLQGPSFPSYSAFPEKAISMPQIFGAISADYHFPSLGITPGLQFGVDLPAGLKTEMYATTAGSNPTRTLVGEFTTLFPNAFDQIILPEGESRLPAFSVRLNARWHASDMLTMMLFALLRYDQNTTILTINADLTRSRVFEDPLRFGAGLVAQARF